MTPFRAQQLLFALDKDDGTEAIFIEATQSEISWMVKSSLESNSSIRDVLLDASKEESLGDTHAS